MSDLFHEAVPDLYIQKVADVMAACPWHTFQILTKRSARLKQMLNSTLAPTAQMRHIWWGVSVEDRKFGIPRIADLRACNCAGARFLSIEPLLEDLGNLDLSGIDWVIVGGESGPGARFIQEEWVISIKNQCRGLIPFFFKQWGGVNKKKSGRTLQGNTYDSSPKTSQETVPSRSARIQLIETLKLNLSAESFPAVVKVGRLMDPPSATDGGDPQ
jgi:protein gp37